MLYKNIIIYSFVTLFTITSAYASCSAVKQQVPTMREALEATFSNRSTNPIEQQQYNSVSGIIDQLENDIKADPPNDKGCTEKLMILTQALQMGGASQQQVGGYELPVKIPVIDPPFDCDAAKKRNTEYSSLAQNFPENKFVKDVINPRLPKLSEEITKMDAEIAQKKVEHDQQDKELAAKQAKEVEKLKNDQAIETKKAQEELQKAKGDFEQIKTMKEGLESANAPVPTDVSNKFKESEAALQKAFEIFNALPAKHQAEMNELLAKHAKETADLQAKHLEEINVIKDQHKPKCVEFMTPIEDIIKSISTAPTVPKQ